MNKNEGFLLAEIILTGFLIKERLIDARSAGYSSKNSPPHAVRYVPALLLLLLSQELVSRFFFVPVAVTLLA